MKQDAGWALPMERSYDVQDFEDELDAGTIYNILEDEIIPSFYERDLNIPNIWVGILKIPSRKLLPNLPPTG